MSNIVKELALEVFDENFKQKLDTDSNVVNFRNGLVDLRTGVFRKGTENDLFTRTLNYDYSEKRDMERIRELVKIYFNICNDDFKLYNAILSYLAYCTTGLNKYKIAPFFIGPLADNGKTTLMFIYETSLPIYCKKIKSEFFNKNYTKAHKILAELVGFRNTYFEELTGETFNITIFKEFI